MATDTERPQPPLIAPQVLAGVPLLALAAGVVGGGVIGLLVGLLEVAGAPDDSWAALGGLLLGAAAGVVAATGGYAVALIVAARKVLPPGRRARAVLLTLGGQTAVGGYGALLLAVLQATSTSWTLLLLTLALTLAACGPAAFLFAGGPDQPWRAATAVVAVSALAAGLVVVTANAIGGARTDEAAERLPYVLFGGITADPDLPGWRRDAFSTVEVTKARTFTDRGYQTSLKYFTAGGPIVFITMHTDVGGCTDTAAGYTCAPVGSTKDGQLRLYEEAGVRSSYPHSGSHVALVYPDSSAVSVVTVDYRPGGNEFTVDRSAAVLAALQRVDRDTFEDRVGAELRLR